MKIKFIGDVHGELERVGVLAACEPDTTFVVLGDVGFGFRLVPYWKNVKYIRGNHDDPHAARMHMGYLGDFGVWEDMFFIGGAFSIDKAWRVSQMEMGCKPIWWPDEELDEATLERAIACYAEVKPDIVISHEAPAEIGRMVLQDLWRRPEKVDCIYSRTARALQRMLTYHTPKHWYFGHYHFDWTKEVGGTTFHCLHIHSVCERANLNEEAKHQDYQGIQEPQQRREIFDDF